MCQSLFSPPCPPPPEPCTNGERRIIPLKILRNIYIGPKQTLFSFPIAKIPYPFFFLHPLHRPSRRLLFLLPYIPSFQAIHIVYAPPLLPSSPNSYDWWGVAGRRKESRNKDEWWGCQREYRPSRIRFTTTTTVSATTTTTTKTRFPHPSIIHL